MNFTGTQEYVATKELQMAVNAAIQLQKPLLIKGEPGTGKLAGGSCSVDSGEGGAAYCSEP